MTKFLTLNYAACIFIEPSTLPEATSALSDHDKIDQDPKKELPYLLFKGMATCHSLTIIDGTLNGDPLDLKVRISCFVKIYNLQ